MPDDIAADPAVDYLARSGAKCPSCGYELRGTTTAVCAECGTSLRLDVVAAHGINGWWWVATMGTGVTMLMAAYLLSRLSVRLGELFDQPNLPALVQAGAMPRSALPDWKGILHMLLWLTVAAALLGTLMAGRRRFARAHRLEQRTVGIAGVLLPLVMLGVLYVVYG